MNPLPPPPDPAFELIRADELHGRVAALRQQNCRLVQIGASRLPDKLELTYSFDLDGRLSHLRLHLPAEQARIASITGIYWCAFLYENELHDLFDLQVDGLAVDFHGNLYQTAVKFPFGSTRAPVPPASAPQTAQPATAAS